MKDITKGTISTKVMRIAAICDLMVERISGNQKIKRYLKYNTISPLSKVSTDENGNRKDQVDIEEDLIDTMIFDSLFDEDMVTEKKNYVFIAASSGRYRELLGDMYFNIQVVVSKQYNKQKKNKDKRLWSIANEIVNLLDDYTVTGELAEEIGNVTIEFLNYEQLRLSKTNDFIVLDLGFGVTSTGVRVVE